MSMSAVGTCSYGDYTFTGRAETIAFDWKPVYDQAGRTVTHSIISVTIKDSVQLAAATSGTTDTTVAALRSSLQKPAQSFVYQDKGFGNLSVNVSANGTRDVLWGPRPQILRLRHLASDRAVEFTWSVDVAIPACSDAVFQGQPMELNYRLEYGVDRSGYSTRKYTGYVRIPLTRQSAAVRRITTSADEWREKITPPLLTGFRRTFGPFVLDEAKTRLDWSIEDVEEGPNYLPEKVVEAPTRHRVRSLNKGFVNWAGSISSTIELVRGTPPEYAWNVFWGICKSRLDVTRANANIGDPEIKGTLIPIALEMEENDVYGRLVTSFSLDYTFVSTLANILKASGLWTPTGNSWEAWSRSLKEGPFHPRGHAKLKFNAADDAIVDLCVANQSVSTPKETPKRSLSARDRLITDIAGPCPPPLNSWIAYESRLVVEDDQGTIAMQPLPTKELRIASVQQSFFGTVEGVTVGQYENQADAIIQNRTAPLTYVRLVGKALRACYDIQPPELRQVAGVDVAAANRPDHGEGFQTWVLGQYGHKVIAATWNLRYVLQRPPTTALQALATPQLPGANIRAGRYQPSLRAGG